MDKIGRANETGLDQGMFLTACRARSVERLKAMYQWELGWRGLV